MACKDVQIICNSRIYTLQVNTKELQGQLPPPEMAWKKIPFLDGEWISSYLRDLLKNPNYVSLSFVVPSSKLYLNKEKNSVLQQYETCYKSSAILPRCDRVRDFSWKNWAPTEIVAGYSRANSRVLPREGQSIQGHLSPWVLKQNYFSKRQVIQSYCPKFT